MIKFYTNQELAQKLDIKLARWKRWSREFLPPDPLGGLQSGYARQYNIDEAFNVFLGGYLVGELKFAIPEARQIMHDLRGWLLDRGFYFHFSATNPTANKIPYTIDYYQIAIYRLPVDSRNESGFYYLTKGVIADESIEINGYPMHQKRFIETAVNPEKSKPPAIEASSYRVLNISNLRHRFLRLLEDGQTVQ
jgi:hypothetical protein